MNTQAWPAAGHASAASTDLAAFAEIKRFGERWRGDRKFRDAYPTDPRAVAQAYGLKVDPEAVRCLWDAEGAAERTEATLVARYRSFAERAFADTWLRRVSNNRRFAAWRQRQLFRHLLETGVGFAPNPHIPASLELTHGCSVGCWFCSISPPKLSDTFLYTPANANLWRGILEALREILGPAATNAICYSGTDPFDNPDYESFAANFQDIFGEAPFTSTALGARDPERLRRLMVRFGPDTVRLSILSLGMLDAIHGAFTPEELLLARMDFRNQGSLDARTLLFAGRAREHADTYARHRTGPPIIDTPSCETGFRFNLPQRMVRLCSPCAPDARWPNGFRTYDEAHFDTANEVRSIMLAMIQRHMPPVPPEDLVLAFHRALRFEATVDGFALVGPHMTQRFDNTAERPFVRRAGELIGQGHHRVRSVLAALEAEFTGSGAAVGTALEDLFQLGVLDDEPAAP